jgi:hypothetical protein
MKDKLHNADKRPKKNLKPIFQNSSFGNEHTVQEKYYTSHCTAL